MARANPKPPSQDDPGETLKTSFSISRALWRRAKVRALDEQVELQALISKALEQYLEKKAKK